LGALPRYLCTETPALPLPSHTSHRVRTVDRDAMTAGSRIDDVMSSRQLNCIAEPLTSDPQRPSGRFEAQPAVIGRARTGNDAVSTVGQSAPGARSSGRSSSKQLIWFPDYENVGQRWLGKRGRVDRGVSQCGSGEGERMDRDKPGSRGRESLSRSGSTGQQAWIGR
jgi:hypothetical protein